MSWEDLVFPYCLWGLWEGPLAYPLQTHDRSDLPFLLTEQNEGHYDERAFSERMDSTFKYCQMTSWFCVPIVSQCLSNIDKADSISLN